MSYSSISFPIDAKRKAIASAGIVYPPRLVVLLKASSHSTGLGAGGRRDQLVVSPVRALGNEVVSACRRRVPSTHFRNGEREWAR